MKLYHGSISVIDMPQLGKGNHKNDYGLGLYCTEHVELAKEWACSSGKDGFVNGYSLDITELTVCDLTQHHILNWMAILLENRTFDLSAGVAAAARDYILKTFLPEYRNFDIIRGYRADDSYFSFARDFLALGDGAEGGADDGTNGQCHCVALNGKLGKFLPQGLLVLILLAHNFVSFRLVYII